MTIDGVFVTIEYGFNRAFINFHIKKRVAQLVKASLRCESNSYYIFAVFNYSGSACIQVCADTRAFEYIDDLVEFLWKELTITKYVDFNHPRCNYELSRMLNNG